MAGALFHHLSPCPAPGAHHMRRPGRCPAAYGSKGIVGRRRHASAGSTSLGSAGGASGVRDVPPCALAAGILRRDRVDTRSAWLPTAELTVDRTVALTRPFGPDPCEPVRARGALGACVVAGGLTFVAAGRERAPSGEGPFRLRLRSQQRGLSRHCRPRPSSLSSRRQLSRCGSWQPRTGNPSGSSHARGWDPIPGRDPAHPDPACK
jgi:hypothetical protein